MGGVCRKLMLRNRCGSNYYLFRDAVTRRDHMTRVFVTGASSKRENSTRGAFSLSDKIVADKFRISLKEFTTQEELGSNTKILILLF